MAIISSLYTGVSGLAANGTAMSIIGDNIANTNTVGFKSGRASFGDVLSQNLVGSSGDYQIGRGTMLTSVSPVFTQGSFQSTESGLDMAIDGDGFFVVKDTANSASYYTRAGQFSVDSSGYLVTPEGYRVQGYTASTTGSITSNIGDISLSSSFIAPSASTTATIGANLDAGAAIPDFVLDSSNNTIRVNGSDYTIPVGAYTGDDLATELATALSNESVGTTVVFSSATGFTITNGATAIDIEWEHANNTSENVLGFTATDHAQIAALGTATSDNAALSFVSTDPSTYNYSTGITVYDALGNGTIESVYFRKTAAGPPSTWNVYAPGATGGTAPLIGTLTFDASGNLTGGSPLSANFVSLNGGALSFDLGSATQYAASSTILSQSSDGYPSGSLTSVSIDQDGLITGLFSNGMTRGIGQVALGKFQNPNGLTKYGRNLYAANLDSGQATLGAPGTGGYGRTLSNSLELSNVDIAREFVNMITVQRAFQANSKIITTSDEMLSDLINLKR